jgi:hypothetical protein
MQAEGSKAKVVVASVGEQILTEREAKAYNTLKSSGALSLVESQGQNQARFATGGVIGSLRLPSAAGPLRGREYRAQNLSTANTFVFNGVQDFNSFKRSQSAITAEQAVAQRRANRKEFGSG